MNDLAYWTIKLQEAEREFDAATMRSAADAAARRLMRIKTELNALDRKATRRGRCSGVGDLLPSTSASFVALTLVGMRDEPNGSRFN